MRVWASCPTGAYTEHRRCHEDALLGEARLCLFTDSPSRCIHFVNSALVVSTRRTAVCAFYRVVMMWVSQFRCLRVISLNIRTRCLPFANIIAHLLNGVWARCMQLKKMKCNVQLHLLPLTGQSSFAIDWTDIHVIQEKLTTLQARVHLQNGIPSP